MAITRQDALLDIGRFIADGTPNGHEVVFKIINNDGVYEVTEEERITPELRKALDRHLVLARIGPEERSDVEDEELQGLVRFIGGEMEGWATSEYDDPIVEKLDEIKELVVAEILAARARIAELQGRSVLQDTKTTLQWALDIIDDVMRGAK